MSVLNILNNVRIGTKVGGGFGLVVVLLVVIGVTGLVSLSEVGTYFKEYRGLARQTNEVGRIQANMLETRLAAKDFVKTGSAEDIRKVKERAATTLKIAEDAKALVNDAARLKIIESVSGQMKQYAAAFDEVTKLQDSRNQLVAVLDADGPQMEKKLTAILESSYKDNRNITTYETAEVLRNLLLARLYVTKFLLNNDEAAYKRAEAEFANFAKIAETMRNRLEDAERKALAKEVTDLAATYIATFRKVYQTIEKRNAIVHGTLDKIGPAIAAQVEGTKLEIKKVQDILGPKAQANNERAFVMTTVIGVVAVVLGLVLAFVIGAGIKRPILAMTRAMGRLADGDLDVEIPARDQKDEIGSMAASVQVFKDNAIERVRLEAEQEEKERRAAQEKREAMLKLADAFESSVGHVVNQVSSAATEMQSSSEAMSATAEETTRQAAAVAAASEQASTNVQTVASAAEELSSSIAEISRQVTHASEVARAAVEEAQETNARVQGLAEAANKIGEVVALITDIAEQTNLLALNATIEAARAGDAGKGFAVVASEVKNLANQTAKATEEIGAQIAGIQAATQEAVTAIEGIGKTIAEIDEVASGIASAVEEQGAATQEIARNVEQAAAGTQEVSSNISGVSQAATDTGAAAGQIRGAADDLSRQSETLRAEVDRFLSNVRAA